MIVIPFSQADVSASFAEQTMVALMFVRYFVSFLDTDIAQEFAVQDSSMLK